MKGRGLWRLSCAAALWVVASCALAQAKPQPPEQLVLTNLQVTYSIASTLAQGTSMRVLNVPEGGRTLQTLPDYFARQAERLAPTLRAADAVVSLASYWPSDPLYVFARAENIRVVPIDGARPWSITLSGVALIQAPQSNLPWAETESEDARSYGQYFWLSSLNGIRMADIIAADLVRLAPTDTPTIKANLGNFKQLLLTQKNSFENQLLQLGEVGVVALANEFVYLTNEVNLFVDGYFLKQDIHWQQSDLENFARYLKNHRIGLVIHKWEPSEAIRTAITEGGAKLVVLDTTDPGIIENGQLTKDGYQRILQQNMEKLLSAMQTAKQ